MTILELFEIAIPALTGIATVLRIITHRPRATASHKNRTRVLIIDRQSRPSKKGNGAVKADLAGNAQYRDGSEFSHCTHIEI